MTYYAHTRGTDKKDWQTLFRHLYDTADVARHIGADSGLAEFAALAALLHDIGKYSREFQKRLEGSPQRVDHATAGAKTIEQLYANKGYGVLGRLLAYCIAGHHGGLPNGGSSFDTEDEPTLSGRLKRALADYSAYTSEIDTLSLALPTQLPNYFRPNLESPNFTLAFATRMIYSILVDADYLETEAFCNGGTKPRGEFEGIPALAERFTQYLSRFDAPTRDIDKRRNMTLKACLSKAGLPHGLFTLTLPTGAGKTLTSMAFALQHALQHGMRRIIYVIPYTSIIEQNAAVFKASLSDYSNHVLEHHSTFDWKQDGFLDLADKPDSALAKLKWAAENWDVPIVVTTNVQFFESLFANRNSRSRKVHNLARSVIIFDEAQMLPRDFLMPCLYSVLELVNNYGASAVFCTATQPALERFFPAGTQLTELISDPLDEYRFYKRVQAHFIGALSDEDLLERLNSHSQVLCIVNTRKHARALFVGLQGEGCFHLSTLMCPAHRRETIAEIRRRLAAGLSCRVISTQLLEAGVDLDFPVGYRALAGLDSIVQAAGRVNRENHHATGELFVFEPRSEHANLPKMIRQAAEIARLILQRHVGQDLLGLETIRDYYAQVYSFSAADAFDSREILACFNKNSKTLSFDFAKAAEKFRLIDEDTLPVLVTYDETARALLEELDTTNTPLSVLRRLQTYTVNIYRPEYEALAGRGFFRLVGGQYAVVQNEEEYYDKDIGLMIADRQGGYGIIVDE